MIHLTNTLIDEETKKNWKIPTTSMFDIIEEDEFYWFLFILYLNWNKLQITERNDKLI